MIGKTGKLTKVATSAEAFEVLEERKKDGELGYEQQLACEHAKKFAKMDVKKAEKLKKELQDLGFGERTAVMIVDIMPMDIMQLKHIAANEKKTVDESTISKAFGVVEAYRGK